MDEILKFTNKLMSDMAIPYTFDAWDKDLILPQFVGEIIETPTVYEDGQSEYAFILTGYAKKYSDLLKVADNLKNRFKTSEIINGIVVKYDNTITIDSGTDELKQVQINLNIKKWG